MGHSLGIASLAALSRRRSGLVMGHLPPPRTHRRCRATFSKTRPCLAPNCGSLPASHRVFANMNTIDYRSMAEEWLDHVVRQYGRIQVRKKDLSLVEHLLKSGFTLIAVRDK